MSSDQTTCFTYKGGKFVKWRVQDLFFFYKNKYPNDAPENGQERVHSIGELCGLLPSTFQIFWSVFSSLCVFFMFLSFLFLSITHTKGIFMMRVTLQDTRRNWGVLYTIYLCIYVYRHISLSIYIYIILYMCTYEGSYKSGELFSFTPPGLGQQNEKEREKS